MFYCFLFIFVFATNSTSLYIIKQIYREAGVGSFDVLDRWCITCCATSMIRQTIPHCIQIVFSTDYGRYDFWFRLFITITTRVLGWLEVIAVDCCNVLSARPYVINHSYVTMLNCVIYSERCCVAIDRLPSQWNGTVSYNACSFVFTEQPNILQTTPLEIGSRLTKCKGQFGECA